jgi:hypothetical protein
MEALPLLQRSLPFDDPRLAHLLAATGGELHADGLHLEGERYLRQGAAMMAGQRQSSKQLQGYVLWLLAQVREEVGWEGGRWGGRTLQGSAHLERTHSLRMGCMLAELVLPGLPACLMYGLYVG